MTKHYAKAYWEGNLTKGQGQYTLNTSGHQGAVKFLTRFEDDRSASSPEELIGAAHASCFTMAFSHALDQAGFPSDKIEAEAEVTLAKTPKGFSITEILLKAKGTVKEISREKFLEIAEEAKKNCPVSQALAGVDIKLQAELL